MTPRAAAQTPVGSEPTDPGAADLRGTINLLEHRLASGSLRPEAAAALASALDALAGRLATLVSTTERRHADLEDRLAAGEARLAARLDEAMAAIGRVETAVEPALLRTVLSAAAMAATLSVVAAGVLVVSRPDARLPALTAPMARPALPPVAATPPAALHTRQAGEPRPALIAPGSGDTLAEILQALDRGDSTALGRLTGLANGGDAAAALQLARLYEAGSAGLPSDLAAARAWTARAAAGGERVAMHNLGLFLMDGDGGPRDFGQAAQWFRRAADRGVVDSQFNLGLLYESGQGVERNLREAYRWFSIAANAGDVAAREKQLQVEARLTPAERAGLDRAASAFEPGAGETPDLAVVVPPATTLAETQALLARQGYYVGPLDGVTSPALRTATARYLRDHPLATPPES